MTESLRPWIRRAQEGDAFALQYVVDRYTPLVKTYAKRYKHLIEPEEIIALGWHAIICCVLEYDLERDKPVSYCITKYIRRDLRAHVRKDRRYWDQIIALPDAFRNPTDIPEWLEDKTACDPVDHVIARERYEQVIMHIEQMPDLWQIVIMLRLHQYSYQDIADTLHMSHRRAKRICEQVIRHLQEKMM